MTDHATGICSNCRTSLPPDVAFCTRCGRPVDASSPSAHLTIPVQPGMPPTYDRYERGQASPVEDDPGARSFASESDVRQNQTYVGNRLMFTRNGEVEVNFANIVTGQLVWGHVKRVLITQLLVSVIGSTGIGLLQLAIAAWQVSHYQVPKLNGFIVFLSVLLLVVSVTLLVLAFSGSLRQPMSEWELLLDDRALRVDDAYGAISSALARRRTPAFVTPEFISSDVVGGQSRKYLIVRNEPYVVYISVMGYGTGLYLAWSMWREQRVVSLYAEWFKQLRNRWSGAGSLLHFLLRAEGARALRETVHNAMREGVESALAEQRRDQAPAAPFFAPAVGKQATYAADGYGPASPAPDGSG
jgi:hypothetical protein